VENAFIEAFNGRLRDECLNVHQFTSIEDARDKIEAWRIDYNARQLLMADKNSGEGAGVLIVIAICAYLFFATDCFSGRDTVSVYRLYCTGQVSDGNCSSGWLRFMHTTFMVNKDQQFVISQEEGQPPRRLTQCAIADTKNWRCMDTGTGTGFTDGQFFELDAPYSVFKDRKLGSKLDWLMASKAP
jgi:integrase-like protein